MRRAIRLRCLVLALALSACPATVAAAEWGGITPGVSTLESVRERFGKPSSEAWQKVEGYDTLQWVYEGARAPTGVKRLTVEFGILTSGSFRPNVVRYFILEPKPRVFEKRVVLNGWGLPDGIGEKDGRKVFLYEQGLVVTLDDSGEDTVSMVFSVPQAGAKPAAK